MPLKHIVLMREEDLEKTKLSLREQFDKEKDFIIDLKEIRSISPSFAYNCFGRLYDDKGDLERLLDKIQVVNDKHNFKAKIVNGIRRRIKILSTS